MPPSQRGPSTPTRARSSTAASSVSTKNGRVETLADAESEGIGVRVLVDGAWGFACSSRLDEARRP